MLTETCNLWEILWLVEEAVLVVVAEIVKAVVVVVVVVVAVVVVVIIGRVVGLKAKKEIAGEM